MKQKFMLNLAHNLTPGTSPTIVWLCGYRSDMNGTKVLALKAWAESQGLGFFRFDYSGHGQSGGDYKDGTISQWLNESLELIQAHVNGEMILVGSSMGGWIALRLAEILQERVKFMLLIAPAPDFTENLIWNQLNAEQRAEVIAKGAFIEPSLYSDAPNVFTYKMIEDGRSQCILNRPYHAPCPVHILQGTADPDVPMAHALKLMAHLGDAIAQISLIQGGDHRLSREEDIALMIRSVADLL